MARIFKRTYKHKLPDGSTEVRECRNWTVEWRDEDGKVCRVDGSPDKRIAAVKMGDIERRLMRGESDLVDRFAVHARRPALEHVADYVKDLETMGRDDMYAYNADHRLKRLVKECGWRTLRQVDANSFITWRERARRPVADGEKRGPGRLTETLSARTLNQYLETARAWLNWCAVNGRVAGVSTGSKTICPLLGGVSKVQGAKLRKRRGLSDAEVSSLLAVVAGSDRELVYRVALSIGLRRQELVDLIWGDIQLRAIKPYVQLRAEATKARRADRLELPLSLAADLRAAKAKAVDAGDADRVFPTVPDIDQWKADLAAAEIPYKDDMGRQADFHGGTRKTLCNRMHRAGVPLAVAMRRMRHTDAKLTMVDYSDGDQLGGSGTLEELAPTPPNESTEGGAAGG